jgi:hypothetical protein
MSGDNPKYPAHGEADKKNDHPPEEQVPGVEKKLFVRRALLFGFLWALLLGLWQGLPVFGHDFILPSIGCLLLSFIVGPLGIRRSLRNYSATKRNANLCTIPILIFGVLLCGFLFWREYCFPGTRSLVEWQPPKLPEGCRFVSIVSGGGASTVPIGANDGQITVLSSAQQQQNGTWKPVPVIAGHVHNDAFFADVAIPGTFPFGAFKLSGAKIDGHLPPTWDMNYDATAIEIVDQNEVPIYQIMYKRPEVIEIYGLFLVGDVAFSVTHRMAVSERIELGKGARFDASHLGLTKIFKYPSARYHGERAPESPKSYELLPRDVATNIVTTLKDARRTTVASSILVYPVSPDEPTYEFSEQVKRLFWYGGHAVVQGPPPADLPQKPGISCFLYGGAGLDPGILRALEMIETACGNRLDIAMYPQKYSGELRLFPPFPLGRSPPEIQNPGQFQELMIGIMERTLGWGNTNPVVVIMIRPK